MTASQLALSICIALAAILLVSMLFRRAASALGQPHVVGEIVAGLVVGLAFAAADRAFLPSAGTGAGLTATLSPSLTLLGNFGLIFMVVNALLQERPAEHASKTDERRVLFITAVNILPAALIAGWLAVQYAHSHAIESSAAFVLMVATAASISAVPVLARILIELDLTRSRVGSMAFRSSCWTDMLGWVAVGIALSIHGDRDPVELGLSRLAVVAALLIALLAVRWFVRTRLPNAPQAADTVLLITLLVTTGITEAAGLHLVFGAFLVGSVFAPERALARRWIAHTSWLTERLFCPIFFVVSGMGLVSAGSVSVGEASWGLAFLAVCVLGKLIPLYFAGRWIGMNTQESSLLAILLNTRGLMELVILAVGLKSGIFSPVQYSIFVMVAVVTTVISMPLCRLVLKQPEPKPDAAAVRAAG